jgi:hypothetical protein
VVDLAIWEGRSFRQNNSACKRPKDQHGAFQQAKLLETLLVPPRQQQGVVVDNWGVCGSLGPRCSRIYFPGGYMQLLVVRIVTQRLVMIIT